MGLFKKEEFTLRRIRFKTEELNALTYGQIEEEHLIFEGMTPRLDLPKAYVRWLLAWIKEWDYKDDQGKTKPITEANLKTLPRSVFAALISTFDMIHKPDITEELVANLQKSFLSQKAASEKK